MLQFFLSKVQGALAEGKTIHAQCMASEMIRGLSNLAKNDFNKRLMVAQGKYCTSVRRDIKSPRIRPGIDVFCLFVFLGQKGRYSFASFSISVFNFLQGCKLSHQ